MRIGGDVPHNGVPVTILSCLAIGVAFLAAVGLLVFAGALLGWVLPSIIERSRNRSGDPPANTR
jgi:hypothetical protein